MVRVGGRRDKQERGPREGKNATQRKTASGKQILQNDAARVLDSQLQIFILCLICGLNQLHTSKIILKWLLRRNNPLIALQFSRFRTYHFGEEKVFFLSALIYLSYLLRPISLIIQINYSDSPPTT